MVARRVGFLARIRQCRQWLGRAGGPAPDASEVWSLAGRDGDDLLGRIVRGEVAGAAAPSDSWARLQRRIAQSAAPAMPAAPRAKGLAALTASMRPYASQLSMAMLLLLAMLGALLPGMQAAPWAAQPVIAPAPTSNPVTRPIARVNRAMLLLQSESDGPAAGASPVDTAADPFKSDGPEAVAAQAGAAADPPTTALVGARGPDGTIVVRPNISDPGDTGPAAPSRVDVQPRQPYSRAAGIQPQ